MSLFIFLERILSVYLRIKNKKRHKRMRLKIRCRRRKVCLRLQKAVYDSTQGLGRSLSQVTPRLYTNSFASCFSAAVESAFRALLMLTVVSHKVIFFMAERASVIFFAAMGAQEPFSTTPTLRLL